MGRRDDVRQGGPHRHGQVEQAPDARPYGLGVRELDRTGAQHHAVGAEGVRAAHHGPGVARVAHLDAADDEPGAGAHDLAEADVDATADRDDPLRGDGVGEGGEVTTGERVRLDGPSILADVPGYVSPVSGVGPCGSGPGVEPASRHGDRPAGPDRVLAGSF